MLRSKQHSSVTKGHCYKHITVRLEQRVGYKIDSCILHSCIHASLMLGMILCLLQGYIQAGSGDMTKESDDSDKVNLMNSSLM